MRRSESSLPPKEAEPFMPDYLDFETDIARLSPEEREEQLKLQREKLESALDRLQEASKVDPKIFDCVVSV